MHPFPWLLIPLGFIVGAFGTLIGAGGGFLLMPVLILLYPNARPELLASISLAVVFFNAASGSVAYGRMKRIDYVSGLLFSAGALPGAVLGAITTSALSRPVFDAILGAVMIVVGLVLVIRPAPVRTHPADAPHGAGAYWLVRHLTMADGAEAAFAYNPVLGVALSLLAGFISSLLGIGGGIIHVPALVHLLNFPSTLPPPPATSSSPSPP